MSNLLTDLNEEQKKAVSHENGPLLIVAGAGTGKTTVITKRIAWLIENGKANSDEILALTFTDKAAGEMEERVDQLLPYGYFDLWISTFHSFCDRILRDYSLEIGLPNNYKLLNSTEQWMLIKKKLDRFNLDYYRPFGNPTKFIHALIKHFSRCKDERIGISEYLEYAESMRLNQDNAESGAKTSPNPIKSSPPLQGGAGGGEELDIKRLEEVANAYHIYQQILLENDALDFGDLINYTLKLFRERPNILEIIRKKFQYILVDEFQDTNWAQYELVKLLAAPNNNITSVADDDQAIYLFRGSSVNNVLQFAKDYPEAKEIVLTQNYRSKQNILDLAYKFIQQNNPNRLEYHLNQNDVMSQRAKEKGIDLVDYKTINKKLSANVNGSAIIEHLHAEDLDDEIETVINKIINTRKNEAASWSDFAILVRANDTAKPFINCLERFEIPYQFYSLRGLYNKPIILDIIAYFKLLDNYHESIALYRVLNMPMWQISYSDFSKLNHASFKNGKSLYQTIKDATAILGLDEKTLKILNTITSLIEKHSKLAKEKNISQVLLAFLHEAEYINHLKNCNNEKESIKNFKYISQFHQKIKMFEDAENEPKLKNFMETLDMEIEAGDEGNLRLDLDAGPDMVKIMTIHSAKGLEFPYVFIVNLVDKKFPTIQRKEPIEIPDALVKEILPEGNIHLEEERRLFYVAMTRAKKGLFFTTAENYGGLRKKKISRFLNELGYGQNEKKEVKSHKESLQIAPPPPLFEKNDKKALNYVLPQKFSYTQLAAFEKCPLQYKFAHILRIPIKGKPSFSFGKTMHSTLQKFFALINERKNKKQQELFAQANENKENSAPSLDELFQIYEECWINDWYENDNQRAERKKCGREALKKFYELYKNNLPNAIHLEKGFNLKLGGYTIKGTIDRIDLLKEETGQTCVEILDYKTGRPKEENKLKFEDKEQLFIYQLAMEECFNIKAEKLTFYYIEDNKSASFSASSKDIDKLKETILERIEKIKNSDFKQTPGWQCSFCDYKEICEYRK